MVQKLTDISLVAEPREHPKSRCGPRGKGSRCRVVLGPVAWTASRKGVAITPPAAWEPGQESQETTQRDGELQPGSWEPQESGVQLEASTEPEPGLALISRQATPPGASCRPKGLRPPSHVRTVPAPYPSPFWASIQEQRETAACKGRRAEGEERKGCAPLPRQPSRSRPV